MTLGHSTLHYMLWTTWSVWLPDPGHPQERRRQLSFKSRVMGGLSPAPPFMTSLHCVFSWHLFMCTLSCALTPVTQFHYTATTAYIVWRWQTVSVLLEWRCLKQVRRVTVWTFTHKGTKCSRWSVISSVIFLSHRQPWNVKPLHGCRCGYFTKAQPADWLM